MISPFCAFSIVHDNRMFAERSFYCLFFVRQTRKLLCYRRAAAPCAARELIGRELPCRPHQVLRVTVQPCAVRIFLHPCKILGLVFFINKLAEPSCQNPLKSWHVVSIRFVVHDAVFIQVFHCIIRCQNRIFYIFLFTGKQM